MDDLLAAKAVEAVVVDHAGGLHVGVTYGRTHEFKPTRAQVCTQGIGFGRGGRVILHGAELVDDCFPVHEPPDIGIETAEFVLHFQKSLGVIDSGEDFEAIANDAWVCEESLHLLAVVFRHFQRIKVIEGLTIVFPLA